MHINGEEKALACPTALSELLTQLGYRADLVAVELNGTIVKQADFGSTTRALLSSASADSAAISPSP